MNTQHKQWAAGVAAATFSIEEGTPLAGYAARSGASVGTLDDLFITALILQERNNRLVILSADVAAVDVDLRREVSLAAGLKYSELAICASHTHSGPAGVVARLHPADIDHLDRELRSRFILTAAEVIEAARSGMTPVDLVFGSAETDGISANRNSPSRPNDPRLSVLATRRGDGSFQAVLVHFACHPTILGADSLTISADFPGALRRNVSSSLTQASGAPAVLFVNGAAGDVSTRFTRRAQDAVEMERMGASLANTTIEALANAQVIDGPLRHSQASVSLSPRASTEGDHHDSVPQDLSEKAAHASSATARIIETRNQGEAMLAALSALPEGAVPTLVELDAWGIGDLVMVAIPGELIGSLSAEIRSASAGTTLILGYTNGYVGYLADRPAHAESTYEALASPFGPETSERVVDVSRALIWQLTLERDSSYSAQEYDLTDPV